MKASTPLSLAPLRARWARQAKRIDALSLRERAILFLSIAAVLAALFDSLVLSPVSARAKLRHDAQAQQASDVAQLRELFVAASRNAADPARPQQEQLEAAQADRSRLDAALRSTAAVHDGEGLSAVLQRLLARQPGLVLERLVLLDDTPVAVAPRDPAQPAASNAPPPAATPVTPRKSPDMPAMSWQGVELQVQGGYGDLLRYLQALERELPGLRWGGLHLGTADGDEAPRLTARLYLLKVQP